MLRKISLLSSEFQSFECVGGIQNTVFFTHQSTRLLFIYWRNSDFIPRLSKLLLSFSSVSKMTPFDRILVDKHAKTLFFWLKIQKYPKYFLYHREQRKIFLPIFLATGPIEDHPFENDFHDYF